MNMEIKKGLFGSIGDSIDKSLQDGKKDIRNGGSRISKGLSMVRDEILGNNENNQQNGTPMMVIKDYFMHRFNQIAEPVGSDFEYDTILRWIKSNAVGNRFYMFKHIPEKSSLSYIFVFFGQDNNIMISESDPMVCFVCKNIPESIEVKFGSKEVFIQPFE